MFPNIEAEMARSRFSKWALADYLGVSSGTIKNWLTGKTQIPACVLVEMANMWNVSIDYLLGRTDKGGGEGGKKGANNIVG